MATPPPSARRRSCCTRPPADPSAPADCARTARCGNARPSGGSRPAWPGSSPGRWRASSKGRSPSPSNTGRRPSPRTRTCWRCRCRTSHTSAAFVETATKCLATAFSSPPKPCERPGASRVGVGHCLQRRESFRRDDEQCFRRVEIADRFREVGAIDVGDEPERHGAVAVMLERLVGHHRPEVGAADADIDRHCECACPCGPSRRRCGLESEKSAILSSTA